MSSTCALIRALDGDDAAWRELFRTYGGLLRAIARQYGLSHVEGEDAAQNTWLILLQHGHTVRENDKLPGWLAVTMRRECIRLRARGQRELPTPQHAFERPAPDADPVRDLERVERDALLHHAIDRLPARQRDLLRALSTPDVRSYRELSTSLHLAVGSIGPSRRRALDNLRVILDEAQFDAPLDERLVPVPARRSS